jgi:hypothetical protein
MIFLKFIARWLGLVLNMHHLCGLTNLIESVQKRALRIILPSLAYEDALTRSGLETLASRRSNACQMFVEKMKSDNQQNNPIANILRHNIHNERD